MSFSKRSVPLRKATNPSNAPAASAASVGPGVRPSPVTGQPTISTGCNYLDTLLAANAGLILGQSLLIEESGTTDYASALLRCYAAEGVLQGHEVHVIGVNESWGRDLPGTFEDKKTPHRATSDASSSLISDAERMKIAWRYERMGAHGERVLPSPTSGQSKESADADPRSSESIKPDVFCHIFDFTKRLLSSQSAKPIRYIQLSSKQGTSPFDSVLSTLQEALLRSDSITVHRIVIPSLLSPAFYPPQSLVPNYILTFLHSLRALLRLHNSRLSVILSVPLSLHSRSTGLTRWIERLVDGVVELAPFPHTFDVSRVPGAREKDEEKPQGMVRVHALPVFTERGGGEGKGITNGGGDDLCFVVSRRKFMIRAFDLPPIEGDTDAQKEQTSAHTKALEF